MKFHDDHTLPPPSMAPTIFVFGSNLAGRHGAGAALIARQLFGAHYGTGQGRTGMSYAVPTKDSELSKLTLTNIKENVGEFLEYAYNRKDLNFFITRIGCGLAGYKNEEIAPMFELLDNCNYPRLWHQYLL